MKRIGCFLSVAVGLLFAPSFARTQQIAMPRETPGEISEAPLAFRAYHSDHELMELNREGGGITYLDPVRSSARLEGYYAPPKTGKPCFFELHLKGMRQSVIGALCLSERSAPSPGRLWLDENHDRLFSDAESFKGRATAGGVVFGPIRLTEGDVPLPAFYFVVHPTDGNMIVPTGLYEGVLTLGARKVVVGMMANPAGGKGVLLIDRNGDGIFRDSGTRAWDNEALPLPCRAQLSDGNWYRIRGEEGRRLSFERDPTPTGKIRFAASRLVTTLRDSEGDLLYVRGSGGAATVPAGSYEVSGVTLMQPDARGEMWSALLSMSPANFHLRVEAGQTVQFRCGAPFVIQLHARPDYSKVIQAVYRTDRAVDIPDVDAHDIAFDLSLTDRADNKVDAVETPRGRRPQEPTAIIVDANGHKLNAASFHYG